MRWHAYDQSRDDTHDHVWTDHGDYFIRNVEACTTCGAMRPKDWPRSYLRIFDDGSFETVTPAS